MPPNVAPHTYLSVTGESLNVVNYHVILNWGGTDMDGHILGFAFRWDGPWSPAPGDSLWWDDSTWTFTTATRDTFDVPVVGSYAERTFSIRAIDDERLADPQPVAQRFRLKNEPPIVSWSDPAAHPTTSRPSLPAVSFAWTPEDYDGRNTIAETHLWLDVAGDEVPALSEVIVVGDTVGAFFPEHFQGRFGQRTAHLQVFDRARTGSDTISWTWNVVEPAGEYLLIDNAWPAIASAAYREDAFWRARMDALFPANYHIYDVQTEGVFRSRQEALPIFHLFKGVVWYGIKNYSGSAAQDEAMRLGLERAQDSFAPYLEEGGRVLLSALNVLGTDGGFSDNFCHETLGIERIYTYRLEQDVFSDLTMDPGTRLEGGTLLGGDSLIVGERMPKTDCFAISEELEPLLWAAPGTLDTTLIPAHVTEPVYLGALLHRGTGSMAFFTTLITRFREAEEPSEHVEQLMQHVFLAP